MLNRGIARRACAGARNLKEHRRFNEASINDDNDKIA